MKIATLIFFANFLALSAGATTDSTFDSGYSLFCKEGRCPGAVAAFISRFDALDGSSKITPNILCSSTLIAKNRILTNIHCLPESLKKRGADCSSTSEILFPATIPFPEQRFACDKVIELGTSDWAVVQLQEDVPRDRAAIAQKNLAMGSKIYGYPIYYNPFFPIGELHEVSCTVSELGYLDMHTFHPESRDFFATDCSESIQVGNSGTAFFNDSSDFVALLNSSSNHRFATLAEIQSGQSKSIRGIKTKCIGYESSVGDICSWDQENKSFQNLAVEYSTLLSFKKALPLIAKPQSKNIHWVKSSLKTLTVFEKLYPYSQLSDSKEFARSRGYENIALELDALSLAAMPWSPACVTSDLTEFKDQFPYTILNYQDHTVYPNASGALYLSVDDNLELHVRTRQLEVSVKVQFSKEKNVYVVSYLKEQNPLELSAEEKDNFLLCLNEENLKKNYCADTGCTLSAKELATPSVPCQKIFEKQSSSKYLQPFELELPRCL